MPENNIDNLVELLNVSENILKYNFILSLYINECNIIYIIIH